jgi:Amt family ammonium transporter
MGQQLGVQFVAVIATVAYTAVVTFILLTLVEKLVGLRVGREDEIGGLDIALHDERGYDL